MEATPPQKNCPVLSQLALMIKKSGEHLRWNEHAYAERYAREALEFAEAKLGKKHEAYAYVLQELGAILEARENTIDARNCYMEALEILEPIHGNDHPDTLGLFERLYYMFR